MMRYGNTSIWGIKMKLERVRETFFFLSFFLFMCTVPWAIDRGGFFLFVPWKSSFPWNVWEKKLSPIEFSELFNFWMIIAFLQKMQFFVRINGIFCFSSSSTTLLFARFLVTFRVRTWRIFVEAKHEGSAIMRKYSFNYKLLLGRVDFPHARIYSTESVFGADWNFPGHFPSLFDTLATPSFLCIIIFFPTLFDILVGKIAENKIFHSFQRVTNLSSPITIKPEHFTRNTFSM